MIDIENLRKSPFSVEEYRNELVDPLETLQILETAELTPLSLKEQIDIAKIELEIMNTLFFLDNGASEG